MAQKTLGKQPEVVENRSGPTTRANGMPGLTTDAVEARETMADTEEYTTPGKSPAFQFYARDFDSGTRALSAEEVGSYIRLLCHEWDKGSLPSGLEPLSRIAGVSLVRMRRVWASLQDYFIVDPDDPSHTKLINVRLERERLKQAEYRRRQSDASKKRWDSRGITKPDPKPDPKPKPEPSSAVYGLQSSSSDFSQEQTSSDARSKRPIFKGQRLVVFEWMLDDLRRLLGAHFDDFDLHEWFYQLDAQVTEAAIVIPQRDGGKWLQEQTTAEAVRRGLPVASAGAKRRQPEPRVEALNEHGEDWFAECRRIHEGRCNGRYAHWLQKGIDEERAKVRA